MSSSEKALPGREPRQGERQDAGELLARLTGDDEQLSRSERASVLASFAGALAGSAKAAGAAAVVTGRWLADMLVDLAPRLPLRDAETLRAHHPGRSREEIADALISGGTKATTAVGALGGAATAATLATARQHTLLSVPVQIAAETLAVAAIEVKLIAELHELYGVYVPGTPAERAVAHVQAWSSRRGIDVLDPGAVSAVLGEAAKRHLQRRLLGRAGRNLSTLGPYLTGAVAGGVVNFRETRKLGTQVRDDLRRIAGAG
jgi:hypothetical protein